MLLGILKSYSQETGIDPLKLDSLKKSIEQSKKNFKAWQDSFNKRQDSLYNAAIKEANAKNNSEDVNTFVADNKEQQKNRNQLVLTILIAILFVTVLIIALRRRRT